MKYYIVIIILLFIIAVTIVLDYRQTTTTVIKKDTLIGSQRELKIFNKNGKTIYGETPEPFILNNLSKIYCKNKTITTTTGISFSGGGSRAASCCLGSLDYLFHIDKLNLCNIQYISSNSGASWVVGSLLYYNTSNTEKITKNLFNTIQNNIVNNRMDIDWVKGIKNSFYKELGDDSWGTNTTGYIKHRPNTPIPIIVQTVISPKLIGNDNIPMDSTPYSYGYYNNYTDYMKYFDIKLTKPYNPSPLKITGCYNVENKRRQRECMLGNNYTKMYTGDWIPCNFGLYQQGFCGDVKFINPKYFIEKNSITTTYDLNVSVDGKDKSDNMPNDGKNEVCKIIFDKYNKDTSWNSVCIPHAFPLTGNYVITKKTININKKDFFSGRFVSQEHDNWTPHVMSGTSSLAAGKAYATLPIAGFLEFKEKITPNTEYTTNDTDIYTIDGFLTDDSATLSLLHRKVDRIVSCVSPYFSPYDGNFLIYLNFENEIFTDPEGNYYFLRFVDLNKVDGNGFPTNLFDESDMDGAETSYDKDDSYNNSIIKLQKRENGQYVVSINHNGMEIENIVNIDDIITKSINKSDYKNYNCNSGGSDIIHESNTTITINKKTYNMFNISIGVISNIINSAGFTTNDKTDSSKTSIQSEINKTKNIIFKQLKKNYYKTGFMTYENIFYINPPENDLFNLTKYKVNMLFVVMVNPWRHFDTFKPKDVILPKYNDINPCTVLPIQSQISSVCANQSCNQNIIPLFNKNTQLSKISSNQVKVIKQAAAFITKNRITPFLNRQLV